MHSFGHILSLLQLCTLILANPVSPLRCSSSNDHLDPASKKFMSDCSDTTFCSGTNVSTSTCIPRQCRRDEFPFGFPADAALPPMCPRGSFCPDEGSGCRPLVSVGGACQLNRDEQCAPSPPPPPSVGQQNSLCLASICTYANATLGDRCTSDDTVYTDVAPDGEPVFTTVTRDNCLSPTLYCESGTCKPTLALGASCVNDRQCTLMNCVSGACASAPETPLRIAPWQSALTASAIVAAVITICMSLTMIHKRHALDQSRALHDYLYQQARFRHSIAALRAEEKAYVACGEISG